MSQPKLTERIARLEEAILDIKTIIEQKDNLGDLISKLQRAKTIRVIQEQTPAPVEPVVVPVEPVVVPAPAQVEPEEPAPAVAPAPEPFTPAPLLTKPSLVMVLSSLSPSSTSNEQRLVKRYKKYIDDFLDESPTDEHVLMDYRILALTMEFVSAAEKELRFLTNSKETTRTMSVAAVIWLIQTYIEYNNKAALALPVNIALLIDTVYDMLLTTHYVIKAPDVAKPQGAQERKVGRFGLYWSTIRKRWSHRKDPGCLP